MKKYNARTYMKDARSVLYCTVYVSEKKLLDSIIITYVDYVRTYTY